MKKLMLSIAIVLGCMSCFANVPSTQNTVIIHLVQDEYTEIVTNDLPESIKKALKTSYPDAIINKAYVNKNKKYKIEITVGDQKAAVFADVNGNWIKK